MVRAFCFIGAVAIFLLAAANPDLLHLFLFFDLYSAILVVMGGILFTLGAHGWHSLGQAMEAALASEPLPANQAAAHQHVLQTLRVTLCGAGVTGTLIGLVKMLANMSDPNTIGSALAVALLTSLYAVVLAELLVVPLQRKIGGRADASLPDAAKEDVAALRGAHPIARKGFKVLAGLLLIAAMTIDSWIAIFIDTTAVMIVLIAPCLLSLSFHSFPTLIAAWSESSQSTPLAEADVHQRVFNTSRQLILAAGGTGFFIGMVSIFANMSDPSMIGPALALSLLSLFYAIGLSELVLTPRMQRLALRRLAEPSEPPRSAPQFSDRPPLLLVVSTLATLCFFFVILASFATFHKRFESSHRLPANSVPTSLDYAGHGEGSVSPEILEAYAPPRIPSAELTRIQSYLDIRSPSSGMISNSGWDVFMNWSVTGTNQVWRLSKDQSFPVQLTGGQDSTYLRGLLSDGKTLVVSRDSAGSEYFGLYLLKTSGGALRPIKEAKKVKVNLQWTAEDANVLYYTANDKNRADYTLYRYLVAEDRHEVVSEQPGYWFLADKQGDQLLLVKAKGNTSREVYRFDETNKKLTPILGQNEEEQYSVSFNDKGEVLVLTNKLEDFKRLYVLRDGELVPLSPKTGIEISSFFTDRSKTRIHLRLVKDGRYSFAFSDMEGQPIEGPNFEGATHTLLGKLSQNGRYMAVGVTYHDRPRSSYVWDWQTRQLQQWTLPSAPEVDTAHFTKDELVTYPAADGTPIPMFVKRPAACLEKLCPVIVRFHGGPESASYPGFSPYDELFLEAGFIVAKPNVRGSSGLGKAWLHADNRAKRLNVITDIRDAASYVKKAYAHNGEAPKVGIAGGSYGGYSTLVGMTMFAGSYDAGAANVGMSNLVTFLENTAPYRRKLRESEYGYLDKDMEALVELSPITHLDKLRDPLLLLHGANDPRVPAGETVQLAHRLEERGIPVEVILYPDEGHGVRKRKNRAINIAATLRFFKKHLMAVPEGEAQSP